MPDVGRSKFVSVFRDLEGFVRTMAVICIGRAVT